MTANEGVEVKDGMKENVAGARKVGEYMIVLTGEIEMLWRPSGTFHMCSPPEERPYKS